MTTMTTEIYDAFKSAGADEDKAREAARVISEYRDEVLNNKGELRIIRWMLTFNTGFVVAIFWKTFV